MDTTAVSLFFHGLLELVQAQRDPGPGPGMVGGSNGSSRARKQRVERGAALTLASGSGHWLCAFVMLSRGAELICFMIVLVAFFSVGVLSGWRAWAEARVHWFTLHSVSREMVSGRVPFVMVNL